MELTAPRSDVRTLHRSVDGRLAGGVAAGLGRYLDIDVAVVRLAFVLLALLGVGVPLYVAAWLLVPDEGTDTTVAAELLDRLRTH